MELSMRSNLLWAECGLLVEEANHPHQVYLVQRLSELRLRCSELKKQSVTRPVTDMVVIY